MAFILHWVPEPVCQVEVGHLLGGLRDGGSDGGIKGVAHVDGGGGGSL